MRSTNRILAAVMALSFVLFLPYASGKRIGSGATAAKLTEAHGKCFKRGFIDWEKELWGDPEQAAVGDTLKEGMQIGTGARSWAQVSWPSVTTRAWENTVFAVAPNQKLVYLMGGEMLFNLDKKRKTKGDYYIWTKILQARIRGTTVLVQNTPQVSRISVLEGYVDVMNRVDRSVVRIHPGVVYEIRSKGATAQLIPTGRTGGLIQQQPRHNNINNKTKADPNSHSNNSHGDYNYGTTHENSSVGTESSLSDYLSGKRTLNEERDAANILDGNRGYDSDQNLPLQPGRPGDNGSRVISSLPLESQPGARQTFSGNLKGPKDMRKLSPLYSLTRKTVHVFETKNTISDLFTANADRLQAHPLVQSFASPLTSKSLVEETLNALPRICHLGASDHKASHAPKSLHQEMLGAAEVIRVPTATSYRIGSLVGTKLAVPDAASQHWPPSGFIGQQNPAVNPYPVGQIQRIDATGAGVAAGRLPGSGEKPDMKAIAGTGIGHGLKPGMQPGLNFQQGALPGSGPRAGSMTTTSLPAGTLTGGRQTSIQYPVATPILAPTRIDTQSGFTGGIRTGDNSGILPGGGIIPGGVGGNFGFQR